MGHENPLTKLFLGPLRRASGQKLFSVVVEPNMTIVAPPAAFLA